MEKFNSGHQVKIIAVVPAKGSSERIANKNLQLLDGQPLFRYTLEKLSKSNFFDEVYLDTESEEVMAEAEGLDIKVLKRSKKLSTNETNGNDLLNNEVKNIDADIYVQVLCTSPFIKLSTIESAVETILKNKNYDSALMVRHQKQYQWLNGQPQYNIDKIPNSSDLDDICTETMGLYIVKRQAALDLKRRIGDRPYFIEASPVEAIDVNYPKDFELAQLVAAGLREADRKLLDNIKVNLTSSSLSDILDDLGFGNQVVVGLTPNISGSKLLGRAKTMRLRKLRKGEDFTGIYDALQSYKTIVPNDIIVVENEIPNYAYFGELNASLTLRSGASGAIINGSTRDTTAVKALNLPVFSRGNSCQDVRRRATLDSINKPIMLNGVCVKPGSLVFADTEGTIIIPNEVENVVIHKVIEMIKKEKNMIADIAEGTEVDTLVEKYGFF